MSSPELRFSKTSECKETTYIIIALIVFVLILLWVNSGSSEEEQTYEVETKSPALSINEIKSCGCGCEDSREGMDSVPDNKPKIQYAARVLSAEGLVGQPSFQQVMPQQQETHQPSFQQAMPQQQETQPATYTVQSPALRAMFESSSVSSPSQDMYETSSQPHSTISDSFRKMRGSTVPKSMTTSKKEGFSNDFSSFPEPESITNRLDSPFFGPISL